MIIGVTGHRPNRLHIGIPRTAERVHAVLAAFAASSPATSPRVALSALAEGADRLFAAAALDLGYELRVVLPFKSADYETTFGDQGQTPTYRALLGRAAVVTELPGTLAEDTAAYEACGHETVNACEILMTVWDGKPSAGRGGTTEIIAYALAASHPVIWINASVDMEPVRLTSLGPVTLTEPLTPGIVAKLGGAK